MTAVALREADKGVRAAGFRWHDLRDYFPVCFQRALSTSSTLRPVYFMLGHMIKEDEIRHIWRFFDPRQIERMRKKYIEVEKQFFS